MSDLISRADVIEILATMQGLCRSKEALVHNSKIWSQVKDIPSAQITNDVRQAKLLNAHPYGECSNCGYLIDIREEFNYCPMCGYKIEVSTNGTAD